MQAFSKSKIKAATFDVVVTRADGTVENLGTVAYYHRNPLKRWFYWLKKKLNIGE